MVSTDYADDLEDRIRQLEAIVTGNMERIMELETALLSIVASPHAEDCQECAIGQTVAWQGAKRTLYSKPLHRRG